MKNSICLALDDVKPGACLSMDLSDIQGRLLLAQGTTLSERLLVMLRRQGIKQVQIEVEDDRPPEWIDEQRRLIQASVEQRFQEVRENPLMTELKHIILAHRLETLR
jgi:hypothetical protein